MSVSFDGVKYGFARSPCSPEFVAGEPHGIKIAAPSTFKLPVSGEGVPVPLCMTMQFTGLFLVRFEYVFKAVKVVLVDDEHGETFGGGVWRDRFYAPRPVPPVPPSERELEQRVVTTYNTVNLLEYFHLPRRKATYRVYAVLEEFRSNVLTVHVDTEQRE